MKPGGDATPGARRQTKPSAVSNGVLWSSRRRSVHTCPQVRGRGALWDTARLVASEHHVAVSRASRV